MQIQIAIRKQIIISIIPKLFLLFIPHQLFAQGLETLEKEVNKLEGGEKLEVLLQLSKGYQYNNEDKSLKYAKEANMLANSIDNNKQKAIAEENLGTIYEFQKQQRKAVQHYITALKLYVHLNNKEKEVSLNGKIANVYWYLQDFTTAITYKKSNLKFYKAQKIWLRAGLVSQDIAKLYQQLNQEIMGLNYLQEAINCFQQSNSKASLAIALQHLGVQEEKVNLTEAALKHYLKARLLLKHQNDDIAIPENLYAIAMIYFNKKYYAKAYSFYEALSKWSDKTGNVVWQYKANYSMIKISYIQKTYQKAQQLIESTKKLGIRHTIYSNSLHQMAINIYLATYQYKKAYQYQLDNLKLTEK